MKKGVLLALLGLNDVQAIKMKQTGQATPAANSTISALPQNASMAVISGNSTGNRTSGNATLAVNSAIKNEQIEADVMNADIDKQTKAEMEAFDEQADQAAQAEYGSDEDSYAMLDAQLEADAMDAANGPKSPTCAPTPKVDGETKHACKSEHCLNKNNKDSSDDECTCKPAPYTAANEARIMGIQLKRKEAAEKAKVKAAELRKKAEDAVTAAHTARLDALKLASAASEKASELAVKATKAAQKKINTEGKWKQKTSLVESEQKDLKVKRTTHEWEETVVAKHEMWATYRTIKKELSISSHNVHSVKHQLSEAESKVVRLKKLAALNPKDIGNKEKIAEAEKLVSVVGKQLGDAETQQLKVEEELKTTLAKAQQASINSAKAKASAEAAFRQMVISNNRVCNLCEHGKEKIAKRRAEIAAAIREETKRKAERMARRHQEKQAKRIQKERECRAMGVPPAECAARAGAAPAAPAAPAKSFAQQASVAVEAAPVVAAKPVAPVLVQAKNTTLAASNVTAPAAPAQPVLAQQEKKPTQAKSKAHKSHKKAKHESSSDDEEEAFDKDE